ncbi:MAG: hypothetical protein AB8B99_22315 [Phormidesmis sp.]
MSPKISSSTPPSSTPPSSTPPSAALPLQALTVLAPAGAEYKAIEKGFRCAEHAPTLIAVPAGQAVGKFAQSLERGNKLAANVLLIGLGGGLSTKCEVGSPLLLKQVWNATHQSVSLSCHEQLTAQISVRLSTGIGVGVMCDRVITTVQEKLKLGDRYQAEVVDMESFSLLQALPHHNVAILRVISDSCDHDLPDISQAVRPDGSLNGVSMAMSFAKQPIAAIKFIKSSLTGLSQLQQIGTRLLNESG